MKIVLNIKDDLSPYQDDLLVYNAKKEQWEAITKTQFLSDVYAKIAKDYKELLAKIEASNEIINKNSENIKKIAEITKESL